MKQSRTPSFHSHPSIDPFYPSISKFSSSHLQHHRAKEHTDRAHSSGNGHSVPSSTCHIHRCTAAARRAAAPTTGRALARRTRRLHTRRHRRRLRHTGGTDERVLRDTAGRSASDGGAVAKRAGSEASGRREVASVGGTTLGFVVRVESDVEHLRGVAHREIAVDAGGAVTRDRGAVGGDTTDCADEGSDVGKGRDDALIVDAAQLGDDAGAKSAVRGRGDGGGHVPGGVGRGAGGRSGHGGGIGGQRGVGGGDGGGGRGEGRLVVCEVGVWRVSAAVSGDVSETEVIGLVDEFLRQNVNRSRN